LASKWNPKYIIDVVKVYNRAYESEDSELVDKIRPIISSESFKLLYGQRVVDKIVERTQKGVNKSNGSLGTYSESYKESLIFKVYKSGESRVNLTLTGDMLNSLRMADKKNQIIINLEGDENRGKAQGHISGKYGKKGKSKYDRDFLGLPEDLEDSILKKTIRDIRQANLEDLVSEIQLTDG